MALQKAKLIKKAVLTHDVFQLTFESENQFNFEAGNFITIKITDQEKPCFRAYSISSPPKEGSNQFEIIVKIVENGSGSNWLNQIEEGEEVEFMGPNGKFVFNEESQKDAVFIATGTGIAPLKSMILDQINKGNQQNLELIFGLRHIKNTFLKEEFENLQNESKNFRFVFTLSQPEDHWDGNQGRVTKILQEKEIDTKNTQYYLCGLKAMVDEVHQILIEKGVDEGDIFFEKYD